MVAFAPTTTLIGFCSRDPIGYFAGPNLVRYVRSRPVDRADPSGFAVYVPSAWSDETIELDFDWWIYRYMGQFGCRPENYTKGCIGVVQDFVGKIDLRDGTECYYFPSLKDTLVAAEQAFKQKKCDPCHFPAMFAFNYWTNGKGPKACKTCGRVTNPHFPPTSEPGSPPGIPFDFCVRMLDDIWLGATTTPTNGGVIVLWPDLETFANAHTNYDTTVICVTCTGAEYVHCGILGLNPHYGPCNAGEFECLGTPPFPRIFFPKRE